MKRFHGRLIDSTDTQHIGGLLYTTEEEARFVKYTKSFIGNPKRGIWLLKMLDLLFLGQQISGRVEIKNIIHMTSYLQSNRPLSIVPSSQNGDYQTRRILPEVMDKSYR